MAEALAGGDRGSVGRLARESFVGARDLYEIVSSEMSAMHEAIMDAPGAFGARGAGAGFGGCLVAFVDYDLVEVFREQVSRRYAEMTGIQPQIYPCRAAEGAGLLGF